MECEDKSVNFTDWIIKESKLRNEFFSWWSKCNKESPDIYRDKLEPHEWKGEFEWWLLCRERGTCGQQGEK